MLHIFANTPQSRRHVLCSSYAHTTCIFLIALLNYSVLNTAQKLIKSHYNDSYASLNLYTGVVHNYKINVNLQRWNYDFEDLRALRNVEEQIVVFIPDYSVHKEHKSDFKELLKGS